MDDLSKVTRIEVIDHRHKEGETVGRAFVLRDDDMEVWPSLQDDGKTLKLFMARRATKAE